eukprot:CAMPEP_0172212910 /NCGR_PEP_ID=MMETSP1050-20130122/37295_1 /TAXON_ID=233186 /ORGANISM="Cryptomonas curvata, Strain CCAP979/52" /LENGTH=431 /DNA_ID=CAMNT_0012893675 /DNA_START=237 /DNA_END=1529 /DNA_ORIENTATION=-
MIPMNPNLFTGNVPGFGCRTESPQDGQPLVEVSQNVLYHRRYVSHSRQHSQLLRLTWLVADFVTAAGLAAGNNSCTYGKNTSECITAHHRGAVNTGLAISWVVKNFPSVTQILALGTGVLSTSKADGGHGAAFWTKYLQEKYPSAKVRTIIDSSMALFGPDWFKKMKDDPWGSIKSKVPDADSNSKTAGDYLLPKVEDWSITSDDMSAYYELISKTVPTVAFAEASSIDEPVQQMAFVGTGGKLEDCCLDGCSCDFRTDSAGRTLPYGVRQGIPPYGLRGGQLDWIKTLKVTVLRRMTRMENNYRAWLIKGLRQPSRFLFPNADWFSNFYPRPGMEITPTGNFLQNWAFRFANGAINFNDDGTISGSQLSISNSFEDKAFGSSICSGCLENIPGSRPFEQKCNASLGDGETLYTASAKYKTDWMALWTLNG